MANRRERRRRRKRGKNDNHCRILHGADFINSMPDDILHHILSFLPTDLAMTTCVLSRRWRHVWCETPSLYINESFLKDGATNRTLTSYKAPNITSCNLIMRVNYNAAKVDNWIEFALSRNVQKLFVTILDWYSEFDWYSFPDIFYLSNSLEQLTVVVSYFCIIPRCIVSWKSLRNLSMCTCRLPDESIDNILSGCPNLESLKLDSCILLERLDLSKSPSLRRLEIIRYFELSGPVLIVAPHIHYLKLIYYDRPSTLVDVTSLAEADLKINSTILLPWNADLYQTMALEILAKLHNVERLTLGETLLQILSLAELRGVPFPTLKVQTLIVKTGFVRSIIPGISRLLQNSPGLKKLTLHTMDIHRIMDMHRLKGLFPDQSWRSTCEVFPTSKEIYKMLGCNDATSKLLASFIELVVRNAKTLERMVIWLGGTYFNDAQWFEEMLQMVETISHNNNVSIVLKRNC